MARVRTLPTTTAICLSFLTGAYADGSEDLVGIIAGTLIAIVFLIVTVGLIGFLIWKKRMKGKKKLNKYYATDNVATSNGGMYRQSMVPTHGIHPSIMRSMMRSLPHPIALPMPTWLQSLPRFPVEQKYEDRILINEIDDDVQTISSREKIKKRKHRKPKTRRDASDNDSEDIDFQLPTSVKPTQRYMTDRSSGMRTPVLPVENRGVHDLENDDQSSFIAAIGSQFILKPKSEEPSVQPASPEQPKFDSEFFTIPSLRNTALAADEPARGGDDGGDDGGDLLYSVVRRKNSLRRSRETGESRVDSDTFLDDERAQIFQPPPFKMARDSMAAKYFNVDKGPIRPPSPPFPPEDEGSIRPPSPPFPPEDEGSIRPPSPPFDVESNADDLPSSELTTLRRSLSPRAGFSYAPISEISKFTRSSHADEEDGKENSEVSSGLQTDQLWNPTKVVQFDDNPPSVILGRQSFMDGESTPSSSALGDSMRRQRKSDGYLPPPPPPSHDPPSPPGSLRHSAEPPLPFLAPPPPPPPPTM